MSEAAFYPPMHSRNQGIFYRGARGIGAKQGSSLGALGRGIYLSWDEGMAGAFARMVDGQVYAYKVAPGLKLLDAQSREMADIKASMGFAPHEYSDDPMYTTVITNGVKALGYDGVISDKLAEGLVLFDPTMAQLIEGPVKPNPAALPEDPWSYFVATDDTIMVRVADIAPIRARPGGIERAGELMLAAHRGEVARRKPVSLCDNGDGTYTLLDGNSTYANALASGWELLPGVVEQVGDCPQPMRRNISRSQLATCPHCRSLTDRYWTSWDIPGEGYACPKCEGQARLPIWPKHRPEAIAHQEKKRRGNPLAPYKLEVEGDVPGATLAQALARGVEQASDICKITPPVCVGNLGVPRDQMPQLREAVIPAYLESLERQGHHVHKASVPVGHLQATQREINANKVLGMLESFRAGRFPSITAPVIVSTEADGSHHILDGHHRWATLLVDAPQNEMEVHLVDAPIRELLLQADLFEGVTQEAF